MKHILFICTIFVGFANIYGLEINLTNDSYTIHMYDVTFIPYNITTDDKNTNTASLRVTLKDKNIAVFETNTDTLKKNVSVVGGFGNGTIPVKGNFLGFTKLLVNLQVDDENVVKEINVVVIRKPRIIDHVFTGSVATFVALIYINFGCALNWSALKPMLKRPVGPAIGFLGQFIVMPVLAFCIGLLVFPDRPEMRLGMLFAGVSPAGGASNVWTVILEGNLDLSVTMTTISTLAAFGMMPLWLFTVGPHIFDEAKITMPYLHIFNLAIALVLPLFIGWLIQRFLPRVSKLLVRILKGFSALLILFIVAFAIATNLYLFRLASWQIAVAGLLLPWCGYLLGAALAALFKQPSRDVMAIAIETGVQNTGIAIFLLRFSLPQPQADLTTIVPVAIAVMTPIPLTCLFLVRKFCWRKHYKDSVELTDSET